MPGSSICSAASVGGGQRHGRQQRPLAGLVVGLLRRRCAAVRAALRPQAVQRERVRVLAAGRLAGAFGLARDGQAERRLPADGQGVVLDGRGRVGRGGGGGARRRRGRRRGGGAGRGTDSCGDSRVCGVDRALVAPDRPGFQHGHMTIHIGDGRPLRRLLSRPGVASPMKERPARARRNGSPAIPHTVFRVCRGRAFSFTTAPASPSTASCARPCGRPSPPGPARSCAAWGRTRIPLP